MNDMKVPRANMAWGTFMLLVCKIELVYLYFIYRGGYFKYNSIVVDSKAGVFDEFRCWEHLYILHGRALAPYLS